MYKLLSKTQISVCDYRYCRSRQSERFCLELVTATILEEVENNWAIEYTRRETIYAVNTTRNREQEKVSLTRNWQRDLVCRLTNNNIVVCTIWDA